MKRTSILAKDLRHLLLPWSLVTASALLSFVRISKNPVYFNMTDFSWLIPFGLFLGTPLLSAIVFGHEFQNRTMTLLFAQPIERRSVWNQKLLVIVSAVVIPAILFAISGSQNADYVRRFWFSAALWIFVTTLSAPFWTFVSRSTLGALVLNTGFTSALWMCWEEGKDQLPDSIYFWPKLPWVLAAIAAAYALMMLWLGQRKLQRYQALDGGVALETVVPGARFVPHTFADTFRARPTGAIANLIRREFQLLRLVWALGAITTLAWALLVVFGMISSKPTEPHIISTAIVMSLSILISVLAGTLSLGEEKTWGTHAWHMTLPISATKQWAIKLVVALVTTLVCGALLPTAVLLIHGTLVATPLADFHGFPLWLGPLEVTVFTLLGFWCASIVKGTVRAVVWVFAVPVALGIAAVFGSWLQEKLIPQQLFANFVSRFDPTNSNSALARIDMSYLAFRPLVYLSLTLTPLIIVGLVQSRRRFAADLPERKTQVLRSAVPLLAIALFFGALFPTLWRLEIADWESRQTFLRDTHLAIKALDGTLAAQGSRTFTSDQIASIPQLPGRTSRWLRGATLTVTPDNNSQFHVVDVLNRHELVAGAEVDPAHPTPSYTAVLRLASGKQCDIWFYAPPVTKLGRLTAYCR